ncbi:MAG: WYL domain-containing protein [bacterium]|nr:WYL domain-containing protein [bacterium]
MTTAMPARRPKSRPATYTSATRMARVLYGLLSRPHGWSFAAIQDELGISERTLLRYLAACRKELVDERGNPVFEAVQRGDRRVVRLCGAARDVDSTAYQVLSFYFALSVFRFLEGTVLKEGVDDLWEAFRRTLPPARRERLQAFERKFYTVSYAVKDYRDADATLDVLVRALVQERRLRIEYARLWRGGETTVHDFAPYTLVLYRGGLYVIGRSHRHREIVYLAVERIVTAEMTPLRFDYPRRYSPEKHLDGTFGIVEGPETEVVLRLHGEESARLLAARRLHPTQRVLKDAGGGARLTMTVRGTSELKNWILAQGPFVEVLEPASLRAEIGAALREAARLYDTAGKGIA